MKKNRRKRSSNAAVAMAEEDRAADPTRLPEEQAGEASSADAGSSAPTAGPAAAPDGALASPDAVAAEPPGISNQATLIQEYVPAFHLVHMSNIAMLTTEGMAEYLRGQMRDAGNPSDPLVRLMTVVAIGLGLRALATHARAATSDNPESFKYFNSGAIELGAEMRQMALALKDLQSGGASRPTRRRCL